MKNFLGFRIINLAVMGSSIVFFIYAFLALLNQVQYRRLSYQETGQFSLYILLVLFVPFVLGLGALKAKKSAICFIPLSGGYLILNLFYSLIEGKESYHAISQFDFFQLFYLAIYLAWIVFAIHWMIKNNTFRK